MGLVAEAGRNPFAELNRVKSLSAASMPKTSVRSGKSENHSTIRVLSLLSGTVSVRYCSVCMIEKLIVLYSK